MEVAITTGYVASGSGEKPRTLPSWNRQRAWRFGLHAAWKSRKKTAPPRNIFQKRPICLVVECMIGFLYKLIALVLSHLKGMESRITPKSSSCCFIQRLWAQQLSTAIYSSFAVDSATQASFLQFQDTREPPKRWHVPLVLSYLAYTLQSQNLKSQLDLRRYLWDTTNQHWLCP